MAILLFCQSRNALRDGGSLVVEHQILHFIMGELHLLSGDLEAARAAFERTLRNDPKAFGAHVALGKLCERAGDKNGAMNHYRHAVSINPSDVDGNVSLGNLLLSQGDVHAACAHYRTALKTQPVEQAALTNLAWILASTQEEDLRDGEQALRLIQRALDASEGSDPRLLLFKAAAHAAMGDFEAAKTTANQAVILARQSENQPLVNIGQEHLESYQKDQALKVPQY